MSTIAPEEVSEKAEEHFKQYKPGLEELFDVDLSGITLKTVDEWVKAAAASLRKSSGVDTSTAESLIKLFFLCGGKAGLYLHDIRSLCIVPPKRAVAEEEVAKVVVHELGHAVYHLLLGEKTVPEAVGKYLDEGFAEYVSLTVFAEHYAEKGIERLLADERARHEGESASNLNKRSQGYCFFKAAADAGYRPEDVLLHPPLSLEEVTHPEIYRVRRRQES